MLEASSFKDSFTPTIDMNKYEEITILEAGTNDGTAVVGIDKLASHRKILILGVKSTL